MTYPIDVACNDPDNGLFDYCAPQITIGDAEFEAKSRAPKFIETETGFRLSGKTWETSASTEWIGNWCWNRYVLTSRTETPRGAVAEFVHWLRYRQKYHLVTAGDDFHRWFNDPDLRAPFYLVEHWIGQEFKTQSTGQTP